MVIHSALKSIGCDKATYKAAEIREDGAYVESGENDTLIVDQLVKDGDAIGRFLGTKIDYVCITDALWYVSGFSFFNGSVATMFT